MKKLSYLTIMAAGVCWGFIAVFFKMLSAAGLSNMEAVAVRTTVASVVFGLYLLLTDRKSLKLHCFGDLKYFIGTGIISLFFFNLCYFGAIKASSMTVAAVLLYTAPIMVMLMSALFFKEKITALKVVAIVCTFMGCLLVTGALNAGNGTTVTWQAALMGVGSGFFYALYSIFSKLAMKKYGSFTISFYTFVCAAVIALPASGLLGHLEVFQDSRAIIGGLGLGIICCLLPYVLYTTGLKNVPAGIASIMATLEPVVASIVGICFYSEDVTGLKILGIVLVIAAVVALNLQPEKKTEE